MAGEDSRTGAGRSDVLVGCQLLPQPGLALPQRPHFELQPPRLRLQPLVADRDRRWLGSPRCPCPPLPSSGPCIARP